MAYAGTISGLAQRRTGPEYSASQRSAHRRQVDRLGVARAEIDHLKRGSGLNRLANVLPGAGAECIPAMRYRCRGPAEVRRPDVAPRRAILIWYLAISNKSGGTLRNDGRRGPTVTEIYSVEFFALQLRFAAKVGPHKPSIQHAKGKALAS